MVKNYATDYKKYKIKYLNLKKRVFGLTESSVNVDRVFGATNTTSLKSKISTTGAEVSFQYMDPKQYTDDSFTTELNPNMNLILKINSVDLFDNFTYTYTNVLDDRLVIDWEKLAEDFKGVYTVNDPDLRIARYDTAPYLGKEYKSWWTLEMDSGNVIIFDRTEMTEDNSEDPRTPPAIGESEDFNSPRF